jgi:hypothetical protein
MNSSKANSSKVHYFVCDKNTVIELQQFTRPKIREIFAMIFLIRLMQYMCVPSTAVQYSSTLE